MENTHQIITYGGGSLISHIERQQDALFSSHLASWWWKWAKKYFFFFVILILEKTTTAIEIHCSIFVVAAFMHMRPSTHTTISEPTKIRKRRRKRRRWVERKKNNLNIHTRFETHAYTHSLHTLRTSHNEHVMWLWQKHLFTDSKTKFRIVFWYILFFRYFAWLRFCNCMFY